MLSDIPFGSLLCYSPRGSNEQSRTSRSVRDQIKNGVDTTLTRVVEVLKENSRAGTSLAGFFDKSTVLVPMPRSSPLVQGALWPSKKICDALAAGGFGVTVPCLERATSVPKSAFARPGERPTVSTHFNSLRVNQIAIPAASSVIVIDDIITKGNSVLAAASRLKEQFPTAYVKAFAVIRTLGLQPEIEGIINPAIGSVTLFFDEANRVP